MKSAVAALLILLLTGQFSLGAQNSAADQLRRIPAGALVEIRLKDNTRLRGFVAGIEGDGFNLNGRDAGATPVRRVAFDQVRSVKQTTPRHTPVWAWIATGAVVAVVVVIVAVVAIERHNE